MGYNGVEWTVMYNKVIVQVKNHPEDLQTDEGV